MFVTKEQVKERTGYDVDGQALNLAQMMIEAWVGKSEEEISEASDAAILGKAVTFQVVYIIGAEVDVLQQMAIKSISVGESQYVMDLNMFAPYMSPWAMMTCRKLSWMGTRSVHTGPMVDRATVQAEWEYN